MTASELSELVGEPAEVVGAWHASGLLGRPDGDDFTADDVERGRIVKLLLRRGFSVADIAAAERATRIVGRCVARTAPQLRGRPLPLPEAAARTELDVSTVRRIRDAAGFADEAENWIDERDVIAIAQMKTALDVGLPEDALLQLVRVYAQCLGRVADAELRLFHLFVHERLRADGLSADDIAGVEQTTIARAVPLIEPALLYFHRRAWERTLRDDVAVHLREQTGGAAARRAPGEVHVTVAFVDLAGFTMLADAMGDQAAVAVLDRFSDVVREATARFDGRVVKQIGDAFMLVFHDARGAVGAAVEMQRLAAVQTNFPALRTGLHAGPSVYRDGDYLGTTVNVAARLVAEANRNQILVTDSVRVEAGPVADVSFEPVGRRRLRGLSDALEIFAIARHGDAGGAGRVVDPACGMELAPAAAAARLTLSGTEWSFCSERCLEHFLRDPGGHRGAIRP